MNLFLTAKQKLIFFKQWFLKTSIKKKLLLIGVVLAILWFARPYVLGQNLEQPQYQTAQAEKGTLISSVTASGNVSSGNNATITTQATGIVSEVYVANGDSITVGQNIATLVLDQASQQKQTAAYASYLSAQNALNTAKSKMNSLQAALFTANQTFVKGAGIQNPITDDPTYIIQRANWLQAESDYNNQKGVISAAQAQLSSASLSLSQVSNIITAPITGIVSNLTLTPGLPIISSGNSSAASTDGSTASNSQSVGNITLEGGSLQAEVALSEIDVTGVKTGGEKVTMTLDAFPNKTFTGKVVSINTNGSVSSGVTTYPAIITFDTAPSNIYPNMAVSAKIITDVKNDVILVPSGAVQTTNGQSSVRVMRNGQVTSVNVEVGSSNDTQTEITSGIQEGDVIVTSTATRNSSQGSQQNTSPFGGRGFGGGGIRTGGGGGGAGAGEGH